MDPRHLKKMINSLPVYTPPPPRPAQRDIRAEIAQQITAVCNCPACVAYRAEQVERNARAIRESREDRIAVANNQEFIYEAVDAVASQFVQRYAVNWGLTDAQAASRLFPEPQGDDIDV